MVDIKKLSILVRELEDGLAVCMRCGMCQSVCPLYAETGRESDVARGKLALLDGLIREIVKNPAGVSERLSRCLLCGSCEANCPSGVKVVDIFLKARAILGGYLGLSPVKKALFRGMLAKPGIFNRLLEWGARGQELFIKPADELVGTSCARFTSPLGERHFKALASVPFHKTVGRVDTAPGASGLRVAFFVGCLVDKVFPHIGEAVMEALSRRGVGVFIPEEQACCGIPALSAGDSTAFATLMRRNAVLLASGSFDYIVTACATCTSTIKKVWPMMAPELAPDTFAAVQSIAGRTLDISQFLVDKTGVTPEERGEGVDEKVIITYHDPCHLKKSLGVSAQPRTLLRASRGHVFKEMAEPDRCCGCGGSFNLNHYEISGAIGKRKRKNIVGSGCEVVATSCPACMLHISDMLSKAGDRIRIEHVVEVYAESLRKGKRC